MSDIKATVPISGRVGEEDYQFLMEYPISGKVTASEKLRYLVSFFRSYHESLDRYEDSLIELNRLLEPSRREVKKAEAETGLTSELVDRATQLLPEMMAAMITAKLPKKSDRQQAALIEFEEKLLKSVLALIESVLRMGLTSRSPTYNPNLLRDKLHSIKELVDLSRKA